MSAPGHLWHLFRVATTLARTGAAAEILRLTPLGAKRKRLIMLALVPLKPFGLRGDPAQPPLPRALYALGPAYVKLGQMLSTRPDIVGPALMAELRMLQDALPPFPDAVARAAIAEDLGRPLEALFSDFGPPLAAASLAQVHKATTKDGQPVAVKVLRPGIERSFRRAIAAQEFAARWTERLIPSTRRLKPVAIARDFREVSERELDLRMEAAAASEFAENTKDDDGFRLPGVHWGLSGGRVLTTDWVDATPIAEVEALRAQGHDMPTLAERVLQNFLRHALRDGFFHGDMHQGNLRVDPSGAVVALDFGIMGRLDPWTRRVYAEILLAFLSRDYARAAQVHREAGYIPADRDIRAFAQALRAIGEPIFGLGAANISMARLLGQLFVVTEQFGMETREELILLQKTMVMAEGVARSLDPDVNMWNAARPVVESWVRDNLGPKAMLRDMRDAALTLSRIGPLLPGLAEGVVMKASRRAPAEPKGGAGVWLFLGGGAVGALLAAIGARFF